MSPSSLHSSDFLQWFVCCIPSPPPPQRRKIDRSMIGEPTNFVHTAHLGVNDLMDRSGDATLLQQQMSSKSGIPTRSYTSYDRQNHSARVNSYT